MVARVLVTLLMLLLVGCGKSSPPASTGATNQAQTDLELQQLTQAVRKYAVEQRRAPATLNELVTNGYLAAIPSAPAGKKFAIDKNLQVYLANQ